MKGYQFLENDFFELCKTRKIRGIPLLVLIYLRGLHCWFQKAMFFCKDKQLQDHLGLNHKALQRARLILQEKGVIKFIPGKGSAFTTYQMLAAVLLPARMDKAAIRSGQNLKRGVDNMSTPINKTEERLKNRLGIAPFKVFQGMTDKDRETLGFIKLNK